MACNATRSRMLVRGIAVTVLQKSTLACQQLTQSSSSDVMDHGQEAVFAWTWATGGQVGG